MNVSHEFWLIVSILALVGVGLAMYAIVRLGPSGLKGQNLFIGGGWAFVFIIGFGTYQAYGWNIDSWTQDVHTGDILPFSDSPSEFLVGRLDGGGGSCSEWSVGGTAKLSMSNALRPLRVIGRSQTPDASWFVLGTSVGGCDLTLLSSSRLVASLKIQKLEAEQTLAHDRALAQEATQAVASIKPIP